jgi:hypothetical protein
MNFISSTIHTVYTTLVQPQPQAILPSIRQNDTRPASVEAAEARLEEESYFLEASSISRKLGNAIAAIQISREWTYLGDSAASEFMYRNKDTLISQSNRPVDPRMDFSQIWDIFTYFEQVALPPHARTLQPKFSKYISDEIRQTGKILSDMCKNAVFPAEPAVFFNHNWPIVLLIFDKLSQVSFTFDTSSRETSILILLLHSTVLRGS